MRRRDALKVYGGAALGVTGSALLLSSGRGTSSTDAHPSDVRTETKGSTSMARTRMPSIYLPHGGGPWPFVELRMAAPSETAALSEYLRGIPDTLPEKPRALLVVSAHWEEHIPTLMTSEAPPMLYDYYGFPPESYEITWSAPGAPELGDRVRQLLSAGGFDTGSNPTRGFDHGTFIPLKVMYPGAEIPTLQLSLLKSLDPAEHMALGRALAPLRDEGVLIIGSGMSYHDLRGFMSQRGRNVSERFDAWLQRAATAPPEERAQLLEAWSRAPSAREAHPREEHLLPLMVAAGAAEGDVGRVAFSGLFANACISAVHYG